MTNTERIQENNNDLQECIDIAKNLPNADVEGGGSGEDYLRYAMSCRFNNLNLFGKSEIELNLDNATTLGSFLTPTVLNTTVEHIIVNCPNQVTNIGAMFYVPNNVGQDFTLKHITLNMDISKATSTATVFNL